jgi:energy-coupling factor transport system substrate-specific component
MTATRPVEPVLFGLVSFAGLVAFVLPLWSGTRASTGLLVSLVVAAAAVLLALALRTHRLSARLAAVLAALIAVDAALRLTAVIGVAGFSPIFFLVLACGYVFGPSIGFVMGALTLLLSAAFTAGFGPGLPYQMLGCGWVGAGAGLVGLAARRRSTRPAMLVLAGWGIVAGFAFGALLDLWQWPLFLGNQSTAINWAPGLSPAELLRRFGTFYLATSLVYDSFRAGGNAILVLLLGQPVVAALLRFRRRFLVEWEGSPANMAGDGRARPADAARDPERGPEPAGHDHSRSTAGLAGRASGSAAPDQTAP